MWWMKQLWHSLQYNKSQWFASSYCNENNKINILNGNPSSSSGLLSGKNTIAVESMLLLDLDFE